MEENGEEDYHAKWGDHQRTEVEAGTHCNSVSTRMNHKPHCCHVSRTMLLSLNVSDLLVIGVVGVAGVAAALFLVDEQALI